MFFGDKELIFDKPLIMGIINLTPDSFSDGGKFLKKNSDRDIDKNKVKQYKANMINIKQVRKAEQLIGNIYNGFILQKFNTS